MKTHISRVIRTIVQCRICPCCGQMKHWRLFRRTQPGGCLPMLNYHECNLCARIQRWYITLPKERKDYLSSVLEEEEEEEDVRVCPNCSIERPGSLRPSLDNLWFCDICFLKHALRKEDLTLEIGYSKETGKSL